MSTLTMDSLIRFFVATAIRSMLMLLIAGTVTLGQAASRAKLHIAVYGSGFVVDTQRSVAYGKNVRRVEVKSRAEGTAAGEATDSSIVIDQLDSGMQTRVDPQTRTYTEERYQASFADSGQSTAQTGPATIRITRVTPKVAGPLGSDTINGYPSQSYTIRVDAEFSDAQTGKVVATESLLEKLWVTKKAPAVEKFRQDETAFENALNTKYGVEQANLRWLLREFNHQVLSLGGASEDMQKLLAAYRSARTEIKGVTVRQVVAWTWQPKDASAPGADQDMPQFIASLAAGLGAPPDAEGKKPLPPSLRPYWAVEMEKDFGRTGSMVVMLGEVLKASGAATDPKQFEAPLEYKRL